MRSPLVPESVDQLFHVYFDLKVKKLVKQLSFLSVQLVHLFTSKRQVHFFVVEHVQPVVDRSTVGRLDSFLQCFVHQIRFL
jgi:hypothetical protein